MSGPENEGVPEEPVVRISIDAVPKGEWKDLGGSDRDQRNERLSNLVTRALPIDQANAEAVSKAGSAVAAGVVDMKPSDPIGTPKTGGGKMGTPNKISGHARARSRIINVIDFL